MYQLVSKYIYACWPLGRQSLISYHCPSLTNDGEQKSSLAVLPFSHIYSMAVVMIAQLRLGHRLITFPTYDERLFLSLIHI